ncbi:hypothetical protein [Gordonia sp. (in: high G+C Gram-positive bacteria)]|uniref:hypothetical protein n=1 Tax=Gordonia sp. (in: high G+C Gram-positive bacteria) TaxID=84139 RepID=UPI0016B3A3B8|nr:hypothetical protein [Gordonia sp. (in: high G+C Gram-positive bacteria)]NLG47259.1 hypothetical protein [Gordonia sp. (in: high G+C Gram-positive bacteria)]
MPSTQPSSAQSSSTQRDAKVTPLFVGYALMLMQFIVMCLLLMSLALNLAASTKIGLAVAWAVLLVVSLATLSSQALVNRRKESDGAYPSPHLLVPTERQARVAQYMSLYRTPGAVPEPATPERMAA